MNAVSVVVTNIGIGDTKTLLAVKKNFGLYALSGSGDAKTSSASCGASTGVRFTFYYLIFILLMSWIVLDAAS